MSVVTVMLVAAMSIVTGMLLVVMSGVTVILLVVMSVFTVMLPVIMSVVTVMLLVVTSATMISYVACSDVCHNDVACLLHNAAMLLVCCTMLFQLKVAKCIYFSQK